MKKLLCFVFVVLSLNSFPQSCDDLFISEYVEGWSNNKALELYNPTPDPVDLSEYRIVRYSNGQNVPPPEDQWMVELSGIIEPYRTFVAVLDKRDPNGSGQQAPVWDDLHDRADVFLCPDYSVSWAMYFNGDDAVSLEKLDGTFVDIFGKYGERPLNEYGGTSNPTGGWSTVFPHSTGQGVIITRDHTMFRRYEVPEGVTSNPEFFDPMAEYDTLPANTFTNLNWHESVCMSVPNEKPVFSQTSYEFLLPPESPAGTNVGMVEATDPDNDVLNYFIIAGNPYHPFMVDRLTGMIQVDKPEEIFAGQYTLTIHVTDGTTPVSVDALVIIGNDAHSVTFNVDMSDADEFNPETDDVYIAGDFAGWPQPGTDTTLMMVPTQQNPMVYTLTKPNIPEGTIMYKYFRVIENLPSWDHGEWDGDPNREVTVADDTTFNDIWARILPENDEILADFEVNGSSLDIYTIIGSGQWNYLPVDETVLVVDNPDPKGINTSNKVLKFLRRGLDEGGEPHAGFGAFEYLDVFAYDYLHVMVWKPRQTPLKLTGKDWINNYHAFNMNEQLHTGRWVDIVFDLRDFEEPIYEFDFMPDHEDPLTLNELSTIYIDNFVLSNDSIPIEGSIEDFEIEENNICENTPVHFIPDTANVSYDSVLWTFPGGNPVSSHELFPEVTYSDAGFYDVLLDSWYAGQHFTVLKEDFVEIFPLPDMPAIPTGPESVCFATTSSSYYTNTNLAIFDLSPVLAGTISYQDNTCDIYWNENFTGEAYLKVKSFNSCGLSAYSDSLVIERLPFSEVNFSASQTLLTEEPYTITFTNLTPEPGNYTFLWDFGNGYTSTLTDPVYTYPEGGEYSVTLTATHQTEGCVDSIYKEEYIFCSGVGIDETDAKYFRYWVNKNIHCLIIESEEKLWKSTGTIYDILGNPLKTFRLNQRYTSIPLHDVPTGAYFFTIRGISACKFIHIK